MKPKKGDVDTEILRSQKLQHRWRVLQNLAKDMYHSNMSDAQIGSMCRTIRNVLSHDIVPDDFDLFDGVAEIK